MGLDPLQATRVIVDRYISYLETTFAFSDTAMHQQLVQELKEPGRFYKGPIIEATPPFEKACSITELIEKGVLSSQFNRLQTPVLPTGRKLYKHQEQAIRKLVVGKRNLIVSTGTSSGKTEAFLVPILNYLFRQKEQGRLGAGVRALLLYPMNALANDQLKRLRKLLKNYPDITFGSYTGETEHKKEKAAERFYTMYPRENILENELLSRDQMKETPPNILLTNYAMLEYLLLRPADHVFFDGQYAQEWHFLVIDEAHTYAGAKGIETAMLLRRLKDRVVKSKPGALQCIATSATLGGTESDIAEIAKFGKGLFGEVFEWVPEDSERQDVVVGARGGLAATQDSWGTPGVELYGHWAKIIGSKGKIAELIQVGREYGVPGSVLQKVKHAENIPQFLYSILCQDARLLGLQKELERGPSFLEEVAQKLFAESKESAQNLADLVDLANKARNKGEELSLLPARYHLFIRAIEGGYVSLLPQKHFFLDRYEWFEADGVNYPVFEAATCRRCSSLYLVGESKPEGGLTVFKQPGQKYFEDNSALEYYLLLEEAELVQDNEDEIVLAGEIPKGEKYLLCARCGAIGRCASLDQPCGCSAEGNYFIVYKVDSKEGNVHKCPACGGTMPIGTMVRRFMLGAEAVTSVLGTALYQQIPEEVEDYTDGHTKSDDEWGSVGPPDSHKSNRRLLIFSDSRQDAAYFATYLQRTYERIMQRRFIILVLERFGSKILTNKWRVSDLANYVKNMLVQHNLYPQSSPQALEAEAWKWVVYEFTQIERIGLEGLGLLSFAPAIPRGWEPPPALLNCPWQFSKKEAEELLMVLLDSVRKNGAVLFPDSVDPTDEYFSPRNHEYFFKGNVSVGGRIYSWVPSNSSGVNTRLDYLLRIAAKSGVDVSRNVAVTLLANIWERIFIGNNAPWRDYFSVVNDSGNGPVYRLKPELWELRSTAVEARQPWYICDRCQRLTIHNIRGVCPGYRCKGTLTECDPGIALANNHYRRLYLETMPLSMQTREHTAQLTTEKAAEIQKDFYDGKVNVLSCSTTFELGVDVGELETVFMRNVPPTAANYIQRAGRAGRRTSSTAFVLTFAQRRSHDLSHYSEPFRIVQGEIKPPLVEVGNDKIIRRHVYAVVMAEFWRQNPEYYGQVKSFFRAGMTGTKLLKTFLQEKPEYLRHALLRIVPEKMRCRLHVHNWRWVQELIGPDGVLTRAETELNHDLGKLREAEKEHGTGGHYRQAGVLQRAINTLQARDILSFFSMRNVIPKYGFPVDVVELQIYHHGDEAKGLELSRDLKIALSEYAPGSEVVAGGRLWTSRYLKKLPDRDPIEYDYAICQHCGRYRSSISGVQTNLDICVCGNAVGRNKGTFITPEFGFIAGKPSYPGMVRPQKTYSTRKYFSQSGHIEQEQSYELGGMTVNLLTGSDGTLAVINNAGAGYRGFKICNSCGYGEVNTGKAMAAHKTPWGKDCKGRTSRMSLGYEFKTDILQIWFPGYFRQEKGFWESLLYGLLEGASSTLDINRQDIDGTLFAYNGDLKSPAIILFDDVPGGAGHVRRIATRNNLQKVVERTLEIVCNCKCGGDAARSSCYSCLRSYTNQYCHDILNRSFVIDFFKQLVS